MKLYGLTEWSLMEPQRHLLMNWFMGTMQFYLGKYNQFQGELEDLHMIRLRALENIEKNKLRVAKYYNKKVKVRQFAEGELVWKALLPIGSKYSEFGKWSPNWEEPFRVVRCVPSNAYMLKTLLGQEFSAAINGRYLKKYYPSIEIDR
jgi:hypothetical protein